MSTCIFMASYSYLQLYLKEFDQLHKSVTNMLMAKTAKSTSVENLHFTVHQPICMTPFEPSSTSYIHLPAHINANLVTHL